MRITGGLCRGRKLSPPKRLIHIRPTSDRVREAVFNLIGTKVHGAGILDCFAGTGALGIEALSRGADFAVFIDQSRQSLQLVQHNLLSCFDQPKAKCIQCNLDSSARHKSLSRQLPEGIQFDLIFMDPPYRLNLIPDTISLIEKGNFLAPEGKIVVEEHREVLLPETTQSMQLLDHRTYGETGIWIYGAIAPAEDLSHAHTP